MIDHFNLLLALRTKLLALDVADTGSITMSATSTGYARTTGSFITDGFYVGMELTATGFTKATNNQAAVVTAVTALALTCRGTASEAATAGNRLQVKLPAGRAWEATNFEPTTGSPYIEEQYLPGPTQQITLGPLAELEITPMYHVNFFVPSDLGMYAAAKYGDAFLTLFAPRTAIAVGGDTLRVRSDTSPFRGQIRRAQPGFVVMPVTAPLRLRTANSI